jgi:hypothetical protein
LTQELIVEPGDVEASPSVAAPLYYGTRENGFYLPAERVARASELFFTAPSARKKVAPETFAPKQVLGIELQQSRFPPTFIS